MLIPLLKQLLSACLATALAVLSRWILERLTLPAWRPS